MKDIRSGLAFFFLWLQSAQIFPLKYYGAKQIKKIRKTKDIIR
jgi:hypothetical protein